MALAKGEDYLQAVPPEVRRQEAHPREAPNREVPGEVVESDFQKGRHRRSIHWGRFRHFQDGRRSLHLRLLRGGVSQTWVPCPVVVEMQKVSVSLTCHMDYEDYQATVGVGLRQYHPSSPSEEACEILQGEQEPHVWARWYNCREAQ